MPSTQLGAYSLKNESWGQKKSAYVGAEIEELAGLSEVISLCSKAQLVVSRVEDETLVNLGVWTLSTFILTSACINWHDWHSSSSATNRNSSPLMLRRSQLQSAECPFPRHHGGTYIAAQLP